MCAMTHSRQAVTWGSDMYICNMTICVTWLMSQPFLVAYSSVHRGSVCHDSFEAGNDMGYWYVHVWHDSCHTYVRDMSHVTWPMSHVRTSHVTYDMTHGTCTNESHGTYTNESCHTWHDSCPMYTKVMSHIEIPRYGALSNRYVCVWYDSCHTYDRLMSHVRVMSHTWHVTHTSHVTHMISQIRSTHVTHTSHATHMTWLMSHIRPTHVTHTHELSHVWHDSWDIHTSHASIRRAFESLCMCEKTTHVTHTHELCHVWHDSWDIYTDMPRYDALLNRGVCVWHDSCHTYARIISHIHTSYLTYGMTHDTYI